MKKLNLLAFDLGASNGRGILGEFDGQRIQMRELHRFENNYIDLNGMFYWDILNMFHQMKQAILAFKKEGLGELDSFGIDTWGVDYGLLDKNGALLSNPRSYRHATDEDVAAAHAVVSQRTLFERTGISSNNFNTVYQLYRRVREKDPSLEAAKTLLFTPDLLGYFFTGEKMSEYTITTTSALYDVVNRAWDTATMKELGIPADIFAPVQKSGSLRGRLLPAICDELQVNPAQFAAIGSHDTASAVAAIPGKGSFAFCSSGTWSLFGAEMDKPVLTEDAYEGGFSNEGTVQGGYRPLKNIMGLWLMQECRRDWKKQGINLSWDEIEEEGRKAEAFRSLVDVDYGEFYAGGHMQEKIQKFCRLTGQPVPETVGQVTRCVFESLALKYRYAVEVLETMKGQKIESLNIVGGGIRNRILNEFAANATGRPVITGPVEGAAMGNMLMQAVALGELGGLDDVREVVRRSVETETYEPKDTAVWNEAYERVRSYKL